jgi:hypothetical protein
MQTDGSRIPPAASDWKKGTLDLVNAKFDSRSVTDLIFAGLTLPTKLQMGIAACFIWGANVVINRVAEELSKVNYLNSITSRLRFQGILSLFPTDICKIL